MSLPSPMNELVEMRNHPVSVVLALLTTLLIIGVCLSAPVLAIMYWIGAL